jgi:hypothetical protein
MTSNGSGCTSAPTVTFGTGTTTATGTAILNDFYGEVCDVTGVLITSWTQCLTGKQPGTSVWIRDYLGPQDGITQDPSAVAPASVTWRLSYIGSGNTNTTGTPLAIPVHQTVHILAGDSLDCLGGMAAVGNNHWCTWQMATDFPAAIVPFHSSVSSGFSTGSLSGTYNAYIGWLNTSTGATPLLLQPPRWAPSQLLGIGWQVTDSFGNTEVVNGCSATTGCYTGSGTEPAWTGSGTVGDLTNDNGIAWLNIGTPSIYQTPGSMNPAGANGLSVTVPATFPTGATDAQIYISTTTTISSASWSSTGGGTMLFTVPSSPGLPSSLVKGSTVLVQGFTGAGSGYNGTWIVTGPPSLPSGTQFTAYNATMLSNANTCGATTGCTVEVLGSGPNGTQPTATNWQGNYDFSQHNVAQSFASVTTGNGNGVAPEINTTQAVIMLGPADAHNQSGGGIIIGPNLGKLGVGGTIDCAGGTPQFYFSGTGSPPYSQNSGSIFLLGSVGLAMEGQVQEEGGAYHASTKNCSLADIAVVGFDGYAVSQEIYDATPGNSDCTFANTAGTGGRGPCQGSGQNITTNVQPSMCKLCVLRANFMHTIKNIDMPMNNGFASPGFVVAEFLGPDSNNSGHTNAISVEGWHTEAANNTDVPAACSTSYTPIKCISFTGAQIDGSNVTLIDGTPLIPGVMSGTYAHPSYGVILNSGQVNVMSLNVVPASQNEQAVLDNTVSPPVVYPAGQFVTSYQSGGTGYHCSVDANIGCSLPSLTLGTALPVGSGGTGVTTAQGNGSKVQLSAGSTATDDCASFDSNGNVVDAAANAGGCVVLQNYQPPTASNAIVANNTSDVLAYTFSLPMNALTLTRGIRLDFCIQHTTGTTTTTYEVKLGAAGTMNVAAGTGTGLICETVFINDSSSTSNQQWIEMAGVTTASTFQAPASGTSTENSTSSLTVGLYNNCNTTTDKFTGDMWRLTRQ